jgi:hypothetical protein
VAASSKLGHPPCPLLQKSLLCPCQQQLLLPADMSNACQSDNGWFATAMHVACKDTCHRQILPSTVYITYRMAQHTSVVKSLVKLGAVLPIPVLLSLHQSLDYTQVPPTPAAVPDKHQPA